MIARVDCRARPHDRARRRGHETLLSSLNACGPPTCPSPVHPCASRIWGILSVFSLSLRFESLVSGSPRCTSVGSDKSRVVDTAAHTHDRSRAARQSAPCRVWGGAMAVRCPRPPAPGQTVCALSVCGASVRACRLCARSRGLRCGDRRVSAVRCARLVTRLAAVGSAAAPAVSGPVAVPVGCVAPRRGGAVRCVRAAGPAPGTRSYTS